MSLTKTISHFSQKVFSFIDKKMENYEAIFVTYSKDKKDLLFLYKDFVKRGKGIRGALVFLTDKIFKEGKTTEKNLYYLASFFELMHSNLLIHDDIMDQDRFRRNGKTINYYFECKFEKESEKPKHLGNSLAINLADIGFFIAFDFFNKIQAEDKLKQNLLSLLLSEYIKVCLAQIDDVFFGQTNFEPNLETIKKVYLNKTARYTFVLPIIATIYLKDNPFYQNKNLINILENLGILFQITDDLIGFISDETGKDKGSDIRENKKTIVRYFLKEELKDSKLKGLFGKRDITEEEIESLRKFYQRSKSKEKIENLIEKIKAEIFSEIKKSNFPKAFKELVHEFIEYIIQRKK